MKSRLTIALIATLISFASAAEALNTFQQQGYEEGGVALRMNVSSGSVLYPGDEISFKYRLRSDSYVIVFNVDAEGYVNLLAPETDLSISSSSRTYDIPNDGSQLLVSGETGMEFVFALSVPNAAHIDDEALSFLASQPGLPAEKRYRIEGDPFIAANMIAAELVRGISRREGVYMDYTYFYVNERVDFPCYLCGDCTGNNFDPACDTWDIVANFDRSVPLTYPLRRAFDMVDPGGRAPDTYYESRNDEPLDVNVNFYPYRAEVRYISQPWYGYDWYWYDLGYYNPYYSGWGYYPRGSYWSISFGWGWGWGCGGWYQGGWGGYYCSYPPTWGGGYYPGYGGGSYLKPDRFKSKYNDTDRTLVKTRSQAVSRDDELRVATKGVRTSSKSGVATASSTSRSGRSGTQVASTRGSRSAVASKSRGSAYQPRTRNTRATSVNNMRTRTTARSRSYTTRGSARGKYGRQTNLERNRERSRSTSNRNRSSVRSRSTSNRSQAVKRNRRTSSTHPKSRSVTNNSSRRRSSSSTGVKRGSSSTSRPRSSSSGSRSRSGSSSRGGSSKSKGR